MAGPQTLQFDAPATAAPPSTLKFDDQADEKKKSAAPDEPFFGHIQTTLGRMGTALAKNAWDVSTPGIAASMLKRFRPGFLPKQVEQDTTPIKELPNEIGETMAPIVAGGILEEPGATAARAGEHPVVRAARPNEARAIGKATTAAEEEEPSTAGSRAGEVAKRRAMRIPGVQGVRDAVYIATGKWGPETPTAPTPKPPAIPETEGIPWGTGGQGPLELRGKRIPIHQDVGAPLPEKPPAEVLQAHPLAEGPRTVPEEPAAALGRIRGPEPIAFQDPGAPLPEHPGEFPGAPLPQKPPSELLQARGLAEGGKPVPEEPSAALGRIRAPQGIPEPNPIETEKPAEQTAAAAEKPAGKIKSPADARKLKQDIETSIGPPAEEPTRDLSGIRSLNDAINRSLGVEPIKPGVKLRDQGKPIAVPEGHTPVDSSALRSYKYDPDAREFEYVTNNGTHYVRGDVGPEAFAEFQRIEKETGSAGKAFNALRNHPEGGVGQFTVGEAGERIPVKPGTMKVGGRTIAKASAGLAPDVPIGNEDPGAAMQRMLDRANALKANGRKISVGAISRNEPQPEPIGNEEAEPGPREESGAIPLAEVPQPLRASTTPETGTETRVRVPGEARAYRASYQVRELEDVHPSHNGQTFQANPDYQLTNDRDYSNPVNQGKIIHNAGGEFDPAFLITDNPDSSNGPIVIDSEGQALGGNGRAMTLQRVYKSNPAGAAAYKAMLQSRAANFGIDPEAVANMKQPVLVREVADSEFDNDPGRKQDAITDFNKKGTAEMTPAERAIADARRVSGDTLDIIGGALEDAGVDSSLADVLRGRAGPEILDRLVRDGALTPQDRAAFVSESGLTQAGKDRISNLVVARFFEDPAAIDNAPPSLKTKLEKLAAPLAHVEGQAGWDLTSQFREAVKLLEETRAHGTNIDDLLRQGGLFGESAKYSPQAVAIARQLKDTPASGLVKSARQYAADAADSERPLLIGEPVSPEQAFQEAFGKRR